jgi:predicted NACHT family NTPase
MIINPEQVISAITGIANPLIKEKIQRSETVIKLLQQFNLDPEHPPADFSGVYAYTLVEYGVGKPKSLLELFRQEEIKQAFRKAFDHNNPSILLSEVDACVEAYDFGDEIKALRIDLRREIGAFYIIFSEVAKRSRNPADTLMSQQIGSVHKNITSIQEQLDRLPTIEGIRTEIARLVAQNYPALPGVENKQDSQCRAIALAQQMRAWFDTLGYRLEKYEVWGDSFFEWIINVPTRRNRYDRILIRGIEGEVGLKDVALLRNSVEQQHTDEGWLITARRISRAARDKLEKEENRHLACYTFDELIDQDADFSDYLDWLEKEIIRRKINTHYVPLACTKEEIDPDTKQQIVSCYDEQDGWIDGYIDMWLDDPAKEHLSILGEFGTGKTWFAFHYAWVALQRYRDAQQRGVERPRLPLVITLRDFTKALNVENVLAGFFFTQHNIRLNSEVFDQLNRMGKLLLIFDGFDEMATKVDHQQMINNFWELAKVVVPGAKVLLTCRTEHFPDAKVGRALLNSELQASTKLLTGETPQFEVLELKKFNEDQIRQVLSNQAEIAIVEKVMSNPQLLDLACRPVMTELILEALPDIEAGKPVDMPRVYLYAVRRKMERDIRSDRTFTSLADKLYFLCELSWEMLSTSNMSLNYKLFPDRIRRIFGVTEKDLDYWHYDMMAQTMLIRNANGDYAPAHRSFLEFFVAYKFAAQLGVLADDFTEIARAQLYTNSDAPQDYTWSSYFLRKTDIVGNILLRAPLSKFVSEPLSKLRKTFGLQLITKAVMDLLIPMVDINKIEKIINIIEETRGKNEDEVDFVGGNAATLAVKIDKTALEDKDFSGAVIKGADFGNASLQNVNFSQANLSNSTFAQLFSRVHSIAFSPDGQFLVASDSIGQIYLWDMTEGKQIFAFQAHSLWIFSVVFSPDGKIFATGGGNKTIKLWDVKTGKCLKTLRGHINSIRTLSFSPDSQIIASAGEDETIRLWDVNLGEQLKINLEHTDRVNSIAFSPDGKFIAAGNNNNTDVYIWNIKTGESFKQFKGHNSWIQSVSWASDGASIVSGDADGIIRIWDLSTSHCTRTLYAHNGVIKSVAFSNNNKLIASAGEDKIIKLWDVSKGTYKQILSGHNQLISSVIFSPDNKILASASEDQTVRLWNIKEGTCQKILQGYRINRIWSTTISLDGNFIASAGEENIIRLWSISQGRCVRTFYGHLSWCWSLSFSPDGKIIASGSNDKTLRLWNVKTGQCTHILTGHLGRVRAISFCPDGKILASASSDGSIKIWDVNNGQCLHTLAVNLKRVESINFSPNGKTLVSCGSNCLVQLWDVNTGECLRIFRGHNDHVFSVAFSFDANLIASVSRDKLLNIWNLNTGECLNSWQVHGRGGVSSVIFRDNLSVLTCATDKTIKLWDITTGECLQTFYGHSDAVWSIALAPNGRTLVSGSQDETIKIWDIETGKCLETWRSDRPYENMNITGVKGLTDAEIATLKALGAVFDEEL